MSVLNNVISSSLFTTIYHADNLIIGNKTPLNISQGCQINVIFINYRIPLFRRLGVNSLEFAF